MYSLFFHTFSRGVLVVLIISLLLVRFKTRYHKEKHRPFECGFDPMGDTRLQFCIKFFLVGVLFLIFDVEISLVLPLPFSQLYILLFLALLVSGFLYEFYYGGLE